MSRSNGDKQVSETSNTPKPAEIVQVSEHDFSHVVELLENPPAPNAKMRKAIASLPDAL